MLIKTIIDGVPHIQRKIESSIQGGKIETNVDHIEFALHSVRFSLLTERRDMFIFKHRYAIIYR